MKSVKVIEIINGETVFNLASSEAGDDWIRAGRLLQEGKIAEFEKMDNTPMYYRDDEMITNQLKSEMENKIETTIREITLSVIQFNTDIEFNNPDIINKFITDFEPLFESFKLQYPENKNDEYCINFKDDISDLFDELFVQGDLIRRIDSSGKEILNILRGLAEKNPNISAILEKRNKGESRLKDIEDLINEIPKGAITLKEAPEVLCKLIAIKKNGNPLNSIPDNRSNSIKKQPGRNLLNDFVSKYQGLYNSKTNEPETIIEKEYINLIYKRFKEHINEPLDLWFERFVYSGKPVNPIKTDSQSKEGSNKLVLIGILAAIQTATGNNFDFDKFVLTRFGIKNYQKAKADHKQKKTYIETVKDCNAILKK